MSGMSEVVVSVPAMLIDCQTCTARPDACADCVMTFLTVQAGDGDTELTAAERAAISVLSSRGLAAPLRLTGS